MKSNAISETELHLAVSIRSFRSEKLSNFVHHTLELNLEIDVDAKRKELEEKLKYAKGFLISVQKKLSNERFVNNAPEKVITIERQKMADKESEIKLLEESLASL